MIRWLHLSDVHVGMVDQEWLWPTLKHVFLADLRRLVDRTGPMDVVLFTGDLVQSGHSAEFGRFDDVYGEIQDVLKTGGAAVPLIALPGNHDLVRPPRGNLLEPAMRQAPQDRALVEQVFDPTSQLHAGIVGLFANFSEWQDRAIAAGVHLKPARRGPLPGDACFEVVTPDETVGIVALNSTWLQLAGGPYEERLHVDPRQIIQATGGDPTAWCRMHRTNIVMTHQPPDWLCKDSRKLWDAEIAAASRFDVHLFGHMHEQRATSIIHGGSPARRTIQASSLFGLEYVDGRQSRVHGYSVAQIGDDAADGRKMTVWPRIANKTRSGDWQIAADTALGLDWDNSFFWSMSAVPRAISSQPVVNISVDEASRPDAETTTYIEKLRYYLPPAPAHLAVRRIEREEGQRALSQGGVVWISRDWGLGEDGFVWSLFADRPGGEPNIYRLDLESCVDRDRFLEGLRAEIGFSFEQLCEHLSALPGAILMFDNVPASPVHPTGSPPIELGLEELALIVRDYAPATEIVLRGRPFRPRLRFPLVELTPFEEADIGDYVRASEGSACAQMSATDIERIWQHTGGSPVRLDVMLADLAITSLDDLLDADPDRGQVEGRDGTPAALVASLRELSGSPLRNWDRAYQMLEALSALPRGERFDRIRRMLGVHPFYPDNAKELASRGLIETVQTSRVEGGDARTAPKTQRVTGVVADIVRNSMTPERRRQIDGLALNLYFGPNWQTGDLAGSPAGKRCIDPLCEPYEVANACAIIERAVVLARDEGDDLKLESAIRLASVFAAVLLKGDHFLASSRLCERTITLLGSELGGRQRALLHYTMARAVRMRGMPDKAIELFKDLDRSDLHSAERRQVDLGLALAYERIGDGARAAHSAAEVLRKSRSDGAAIQAKSILAEQNSDPEERDAELATLERRARRIKAKTAANNIAIARSGYAGLGSDAIEHLDRVVVSAETEQDSYNGIKAIIRLTSLRTRQGITHPDEDVNRLIRAYTHLFNERGGVLFTQANAALWNVFETTREHRNLLRLFRHTSLTWRLRGEEENPFLLVIARIVASLPASTEMGRELAYYRARAAAALERQAASGAVLLNHP